MIFLPRVLRIFSIFSILFFLFIHCQHEQIDVKLYYKKPDLHIVNDNSYDLTDIIINVKIVISPFAKRTFIYNMNYLGSGKDTIINVDNLAKASLYSKKSKNDKGYKINFTILSYQGSMTKTLSIKP